MSSRNAPQVRRVNMLSEYRDPDTYTGGTEAFFRALSEADAFVHEVEQAAELACRCDELTQLIDQIKQLHPRVSGTDNRADRADECFTCTVRWPCPTIELIEGK